jgi:triosephosphate isomerase (TIM)
LNKSSHSRRRQLVVGNWKMNGNRQQNTILVQDILARWQEDISADVVICPPDVYLQHTADLIAGCHAVLGAQNVSEFWQGAYTGEVSAQMLADLGCQYVIVGHNERRRLLHESDAQIAQKFIAAQRAQIIPVLCVGESLQHREQGLQLQVIKKQLDAVFSQTGKECFVNALVAYEPVWAVGTGVTASPEQASEVHCFIREQLGDNADKIRILYGGSVKAHNAAELFAKQDIDGALLGGASLDAKEFVSICKTASLI